MVFRCVNSPFENPFLEVHRILEHPRSGGELLVPQLAAHPLALEIERHVLGDVPRFDNPFVLVPAIAQVRLIVLTSTNTMAALSVARKSMPQIAQARKAVIVSVTF